MDAFTLVVAAALAGAIMAGAMGLLYLTSSRQPCLLDWSLAGLLFTCAGTVGAFAMQTPGSHSLVHGIGNACYIGGHFGILAGLRRHVGLTAGWWLFFVLAVVALVLHVLPALSSTPAGGSASSWPLVPVIVLTDLAIVTTLWRHVRPESRMAYMPLGVLALLSALQAYVSAGNDQALPGGRCLLAAGPLFVLLFLNVAAASCALIVSHDQEQALRRTSLTDAMTGWLNRRALHEVGWREFRRCRRLNERAFFILFDIDSFRSINERYGHSVGDTAICHVTGLAAQVVHGNADLFRTGGEEFAILLSGVTPAEVCRIAERLRELVAHSPLEADGEQLPVTVSVGVAVLEAGDIQWQDILRRADQALHYAKEQGRNRVSANGLDCDGHGGMLAQPA
jgi:diguanylate cyclase (GGDEF)-like protein